MTSHSLVLELQQEAMNPGVKVSDLLRKALVVATKLNVNEFKQWIGRWRTEPGDYLRLHCYVHKRR
jgi:hypothetical protein